jgi:hypothetical protein
VVDLARRSWAGAGVQDDGYTDSLKDENDGKDAPCSGQEPSRMFGPQSQGASTLISAFKPWPSSSASPIDNVALVNFKPWMFQPAHFIVPT